jgi:hypothetical protein
MITPESASWSGLDVARFRAPLRALYEALDQRVGELAPVCRVSGRCCRFKEFDHTLFLTEPEAALLFADAPAPARPIDDGSSCPWQDGLGRCTAREARPLGCRVYFCDPAYQQHAPVLSETFLARLRRLVETIGLPWNYAPLHVHLAHAVGRGTPASQETALPAHLGQPVTQTSRTTANLP